VCQRRFARSHRASRKKRDPASALFASALERARRLNLPFTVTVEDIRSIWPQDGICPALGIPLQSGEGKAQDASPTLDRLNDEWGYEPGNIAVISLAANRAKGRLSAAQLENLAAWMRTTGLS
jgi:hypothetical protein